MDFDRDNLPVENSEKKENKALKTIGILVVSLLLAVLTVVMINV